MAYRKCPNHGWLETSQYTVDESGETICPACEIAVSGYREDEPHGGHPNPGFPMAHQVDPISSWSEFEPCPVCDSKRLAVDYEGIELYTIDDDGNIVDVERTDAYETRTVRCTQCESILSEDDE